jgi:tetratricopeptide (TPR) repeat protein
LEPERLEILRALGNAYLAEEHFADAIKQYPELLEKAPQLEIVRSQMTKALRAERR